METVLDKRLSPLIKYPGGKEKELTYIIPALPKKINNYYEPFVGGGAVYFAINAKAYYINDKSEELVSLYELVKEQNIAFFENLNAIEDSWNAITELAGSQEKAITDIYYKFRDGKLDKQQLADTVKMFVRKREAAFKVLLPKSFPDKADAFISELCKGIKSKMQRMHKLEAEKGNLVHEDVAANIESAMKAAFYTHFRMLNNHKNELGIGKEGSTAIYFFIRQVCYSSMFRYNKDGQFNVPYGGISYNRKSFANKIKYYQDEAVVQHLAKTTIGNMDFYEFMQKYQPGNMDFVFLDPPYDSEFSTYAQNEFDKKDQARLADYLIHECKANFMIVIKNTEYIASLYPAGTKTANGKQLQVSCFDKKYFVSFQDRNDKNAQHLLITNYEIGE